MSSRRYFFKQLAWGVPASYLLPSTLLSCTEETNLFSEKEYTGSVAVVGGGIAGLHAASTLIRHGAQVTVLEAGTTIGGRIRSQGLTLPNEIPLSDLLIGEPLELGADFIYGSDNAFYDNLRSYTMIIEKVPEAGEYLIDNQRVQLDAIKDATYYKKHLDLREKISNYKGENMPIDRYVLQLRAEEESEAEDQETINDIRLLYAQALPVLNADISTEFGLLPAQLSVQEYRDITTLRTHTLKRYRLQKEALYSALTTVYQRVLSHTTIASEVQEISYRGDKVVLSIRGQNNLSVDKVVVTVPVTQLSKIRFVPGLPSEKTDAMSRVKLSSCMKVFIKLKDKFWENDFWLRLPYPFSFVMPHPDPSVNVLTFYAYGSEADALSNQTSDPSIIARQTLRDIFGEKAIVETRTVSWAPENGVSPFIPGAFSYVESGDTKARAALATPLDNKVYFAGEATHTQGHASTVHGAIETGYRAAHELLSNT